MADTRENVETGGACDIIGLYDTGNFQIGDSIWYGKKIFNLKSCHNLRQNYLSVFLPRM